MCTHAHADARVQTHTRVRTNKHRHTHAYTDKHINPAKIIKYYVNNTFNKRIIIIKIKYLKILNEIAKHNVHLYEQMLF